ncbi:endonuclease/exonuclease/phosphatase family protein [Bacteroidia bacterium]|jgi:predicted extracellular nuclease|nr:endonuclease/exonuclease/phosphatase family protein [Bacteroidia bacterium]
MKYYLSVLIAFLCLSCTKKDAHIATVGFYNVENLFDTKDDPNTYKDEQFTPNGDKGWNKVRYASKLQNLATVISQLANNSTPTFLGVCEIENKHVLEDLINEPALLAANYGIAHRESPDERGIDVGFLYNKNVFSVSTTIAYQPDLSAYNDKTRDILYVKGKLTSGEVLHFIINHWPSRGGGKQKSEPKRIAAANTLLSIQKKIQAEDLDAKVIVMGDFNDEPSNKSITEILHVSCDYNQVNKNQLYNAFCTFENQEKGSYRYRDDWDMLDQIMVSETMISDTSGIHYKVGSAGIKEEPWMLQSGKYEGFPLRTFGGSKYLNGFSDHFPVFIELKN